MTKSTYGESARMTWPKAIRIEGNGQYASVSFCAPGPTVVLCRSYAEAKALKREIDDTGCGAQCTKKHGIFDVGLPRITTEHDFITADLPRRADGRIGPIVSPTRSMAARSKGSIRAARSPASRRTQPTI
jgi:hypothetical protein